MVPSLVSGGLGDIFPWRNLLPGPGVKGLAQHHRRAPPVILTVGIKADRQADVVTLKVFRQVAELDLLLVTGVLAPAAPRPPCGLVPDSNGDRTCIT